MNDLNIKSIQQGIEYRGWYVNDNQLMTPEGEVAFYDSVQKIVRTVKEVESATYDGMRAVVDIAQKQWQRQLIQNMSATLCHVEANKLTDEQFYLRVRECTNEFFKVIKEREKPVKDYLGELQELGEKVRESGVYNNLAKLAIYSRDGVIDNERTDLAKKVLKDLVEYGFFRLAIESEFDGRLADSHKKYGEVLTYQTKTDKGDLKSHYITADTFLKSLHNPKKFGSTVCYSFMCFDQNQDKCIANATSNTAKASPGKDVVKFA